MKVNINKNASAKTGWVLSLRAVPNAPVIIAFRLEKLLHQFSSDQRDMVIRFGRLLMI